MDIWISRDLALATWDTTGWYLHTEPNEKKIKDRFVRTAIWVKAV